MKKWLYGVALGALLRAGNAAGITVHEVLSNGFWSANTERRLPAKKLKEVGDCVEKPSKVKLKEGSMGQSILTKKDMSKGETVSHARWKNTLRTRYVYFPFALIEDDNEKLSVRHEESKEKTTTQLHFLGKSIYYGDITNIWERVQTIYSNKPTKKDARPTGPYVVEDWFPDDLTNLYVYERVSASFYGTEHNAVTNIISDNEAYITGTIRQTGHVDSFNWTEKEYKVDEDASLLRTYTQHITTDADHVYIEQEITENTQNDPIYNSQSTYQAQYTATFKKGCWKGEKETISKVSNRDMSQWLLDFYKNQYRTLSVSNVSKVAQHKSKLSKPEQNTR